MDYKEFCNKVAGQMSECGLLTEEELDMVCGGSFFGGVLDGDFYSASDAMCDLAESITGKSFEEDRQQLLRDFKH